MAVYKVPQDVEAEDKLIGPFGFRQFIYLIIVAFACFVAYIMSQIFIGLILIPLPFIIFFAALALPLRKDQPTETYLAALLQFNLKPKKRLWMPDGVLSTVEITAPKMVEESRIKDISQDEALERLDRLSQIMDTRGWAARGVFNPDVDSTSSTSFAQSFVAETDNATDILQETSFDKLIDEQKAVSQQAAKARMQQAAAPSSKPTPVMTAPPKADEPATNFKTDEEILKGLKFDPYPNSMHQKVVQPAGAQKTTTPTTDDSTDDQTIKSTSVKPPSPDIINLVDNSEGLKVSTLAKQASHIADQLDQEVEIKLH
ncbi:MAG: PrgI family protein [Candidatus Saccharibacteria bacterium]|nr:PrgI family protein [Candidatus Saccharibacteria bacterium]